MVKFQILQNYFYSYFFDGIFVNGKMNGTGTLKLGQDAPLQQKCIILHQSPMNLEEPPDVIQGTFDAGLIFGIANLTWSKLGYQMNAHMSYGMIHGMFKIMKMDRSELMIGTAKRNLVFEQCWIWMLKKDKVSHGIRKNYSLTLKVSCLRA